MTSGVTSAELGPCPAVWGNWPDRWERSLARLVRGLEEALVSGSPLAKPDENLHRICVL